jgi:hypothetical protein
VWLEEAISKRAFDIVEFDPNQETDRLAEILASRWQATDRRTGDVWCVILGRGRKSFAFGSLTRDKI